MKYNFDEIINRRNTCSMKWDIDKAKDEDVISMWVADMDFRCATPIIDALASKVNDGIFGYSYRECTNYYDAIIGWYNKRYDWEIDKENIIYSHGVVLSIISAIRAFTKINDQVIIQTPVYYPFALTIEKNDRKVVENSLINDHGYYRMDYDLLEKQAVDQHTTMMILCSPHNPVGRVWSKEELQKVIDICEKNNVLLISDEIHCDLTRKNVSFAPVGKLTNKAISLVAPSKTFNVPGLSMSSVIISDEQLKKGYKEQSFDKSFLGMANSFGIPALMAAYTKCDDWLEQALDYIEDNLKYIDEFVKEYMPKVKYVIPEGTYLVWLDFNEYQLSDEEINDRIANKAKILLDEGAMFGKQGVGFQRINVACPRSVLVDCMERLREVF